MTKLLMLVMGPLTGVGGSRVLPMLPQTTMASTGAGQGMYPEGASAGGPGNPGAPGGPPGPPRPPAAPAPAPITPELVPTTVVGPGSTSVT